MHWSDSHSWVIPVGTEEAPSWEEILLRSHFFFLCFIFIFFIIRVFKLQVLCHCICLCSTSYCVISSDTGLDSFQQLQENFYRYLQLRHHFNRNIKIITFKGRQHRSHWHSHFQNIFMPATSQKTTSYVKSNWVSDVIITLTEDDWLYICGINSTTSSGQWREFAWKNVIRFFITPRRKYLQGGRAESGHCWRQCNNVMTDHCHIFWWLSLTG